MHFAPRLFLIMLVPFALTFFGVFFAAITMERRRRKEQTHTYLGTFEAVKHEPKEHRARYAYAIEQQEREPMVYTQIQPVYFRGQKIAQRGE